MLSRLVGGYDTLIDFETKKESHGSKASALDLLTHITSREAKSCRTRYLIADTSQKALETKSASVSRAFELAGMPLAAVERLTNSRSIRDSRDDGFRYQNIADEDDVPEFEQIGCISPLKQKDSIDHAIEIASTVVENFGLNDVVSPLRRSVSQLVNTGQIDFDGAFGRKLDPNAITPTIPAEQNSVPSTPLPAKCEALKHQGSLSISIEGRNGDENETSVKHPHAQTERRSFCREECSSASRR